jgi:hypothetical protein
MPVTGRIKVDYKDQELKNWILEQVSGQYTKVLLSSKITILQGVREIVRAALYESEVYKSLVSDRLGTLHGLLGVPDPEGSYATVVEKFIAAIDVVVDPVSITGSKPIGGIQLVLNSDFAELAKIPEGTFKSEKGKDVPWLEWLLLAGRAIVVSNWTVINKTNLPSSRTGLALMRESSINSFSIPPEFAGTEDDNFITRAIAAVEEQINQIFAAGVDSVKSGLY